VANRKTKSATRKLDAVSIALSWLDRGILTVPLAAGTKRPRGGDDWNKVRITRENVREHFQEGDNIGALWGDASGWVIDVDLDWDEAALAAPRLLPETFVYGRESRPRTHYLYRVTNAKSAKWVAPSRAVIAELRSSGMQSVIPPSVHPTGERYCIDDDREIASISSAELRVRLTKISAIALLAQAYPEQGARHDYLHALVGALSRDGWKDRDVLELGKALLDAVGADEDSRREHERTMRNTVEHAKGGDKTYGWNTLRDMIDAPILKRIREWLTLRGRDEVPTVTIKSEAESKSTYSVPHRLLEPVGLVGEVAAWSRSRSYISQPVFDLAVGINATAMLTINRYIVDAWDTPLQPYTMLLAPTSGGKDSALQSVYELLRRGRLGESAFQGFQSYHALLDRLAVPPSLAMWLWDEAARKLRTASRSSGGQDYQILTWLLSLYGRAASSAPGMPGRHNAIPAVDWPFLTIMATAQPQQLVEAVTAGDLGTGVINRFILFDAGDGLAGENVRRDTTFPSSLEASIRALRSLPVPTGDFPFERIRFATNDAYSAFREFSAYARERSIEGDTGEVWGRANQNALILAGCVAAGCGMRPKITLEIARWAIDFAMWSFDRWTARLERGVARNFIEEKSMRVENVIRDSTKYAKGFARDPKKAKLLARGLMPRSVLSRLTRSLSRRELDEHLETLVEGDLISIGDEDGVTVYWSRKS